MERRRAAVLAVVRFAVLVAVGVLTVYAGLRGWQSLGPAVRHVLFP